MKILSIGSDKKLFDENSEVRRRVIEYGRLIDELHIIVFNQKTKKCTYNCDSKYMRISENIYVYPTNSLTKWFYVFDAVKIGRNILSFTSANTSDRKYLPDWLITSQDPFECGFVGWLLKRRYKIPLQLQIHTDFLSPYFKKESFLSIVRVLIAKFLIKRADCFRVVSRRIKLSLSGAKVLPKNRRCGRANPPAGGFRDKRFLEEAFAERCLAVLPIFVDIKKIQEAVVKTDLHQKYPQFDFIILMASRLTREKNIGLAIGAMQEVAKKHPKTGLIIVGNGPEEKNLALLVTRYSLRKNAIFEPWTDDIISYYKTADLFPLTSNYEGYGMAVVEAMAAGCPVVMTDVGLAGEVLIDKKDGIVIPVGDREKLVEAILNLIENPELRADLVRNSQKTMNFWPKKDDYLKAYRDSWLLCK